MGDAADDAGRRALAEYEEEGPPDPIDGTPAIDDIPEELTMVWFGPDLLRPHLRPLSELKQLEGNHREHNVPMLMESLKLSGQYVPFIVRENEDGTATLLVGNGRTKAAIELGWTHVAVWPKPVTGDDEAALFALVDNISHDAGRTLIEGVQESLTDALAAAGYVEAEEYTRAAADLIREARGSEAEHSFAETDSEAAERARELAQSQRMKEAVMTMPIAEYERLGTMVRFLMPKYGTRGLGDTVMEALDNEVKRLESEES